MNADRSCACFASIEPDGPCADAAPAGRDVAHTRSGAAGELTARRLVAAQRVRHLREGIVEHVVQQKRRALERREPIERQQQRDRQILGELGLRIGRERSGVGDRIRQPRPDILLTPHTRRLQHVETNARRRRRQKRPRVRDAGAIGVVPAQVGFLDGVLGLGHRAKHAIRQSEQTPPVRLEARGWIGRHHRCAVATARSTPRSNAIGAPPTTMRVHALPCPIAYLTVG